MILLTADENGLGGFNFYPSDPFKSAVKILDPMFRNVKSRVGEKFIRGFAGAHFVYLRVMRYLVKARVKRGQEKALLRAVAEGSLGRGSIAGDEYLYDMEQARLREDGTTEWVEVCYCATPLQEERPYWEEFFELIRVQDAHSRRNCRHENGTEPWACSNCNCTQRLEERLQISGKPFIKSASCVMLTSAYVDIAIVITYYTLN